MNPTTAAEYEQFLSNLSQTIKHFNSLYEAAVAAEEETNNEIQDLLHTLEIDPASIPANFPFNSFLISNRQKRRAAKKEEMALSVIRDYLEENKAAFNKLDNCIGQLRKKLNYQSSAIYTYKTSLIKEKGSFLLPEELADDRR